MKPCGMFWLVKVIHFYPQNGDRNVVKVEALSSGSALALVVEQLQEASRDYMLTRVEGPYVR